MAGYLSGNTVLPLLSVQGTVGPPPTYVEGVVTLPMLVVAGEFEHGVSLNGDTHLKMLRVRGEITDISRKLTGQVVLPRLQTSFGGLHGLQLRVGGNVFLLTGAVRATGGTLLTFVGPPDRTVAWSILDGGGALYPVTDYTDAWGRAVCLYQAGGWVGETMIQVEYGR